ncbi:MAG: glycosyl hydrolase [Thermoanaerobaculia bacterium]
MLDLGCGGGFLRRLGAVAAMATLGAGAAHAAGTFDLLKFRSIGPALGGRVSRVAGVAGDPLTFYAATAQSGVFKSVDGGHTWKPVFDEQPLLTTGAIAVAASDPNVIYVGTGEANIRGNVQPGNGIYKSTDAGKSWKQVLDQEGQIGTIVVHPANPEIAFAALLGHAFGPNPERGVYRTLDGGKSWSRVLGGDSELGSDTGASDVAFDPGNPHILFAGLWQARRYPWGMTSGGPGSGLYRSADGGETWTRLTGKGLPEGIWGKVGVAVAPSSGARVYALIEAEKGGLFRSDDGGTTWRLANGHNALSQRAWYYSTLTIDPVNPDIVWFPQVALLRTIDGGRTIQSVDGIHHGDVHDLWIDPKARNRILIGNDGGVDLSFDGGASWFAPPVAWSQFYNVDADDRDPYAVGGTVQDEGTAIGPADSLRSEGIVLGDWKTAGGGEAGDFVFDRGAEGVVYAGEYGGIMTRWEEKSGNERNISYYPTNPSGHGAEDLRVRFQWTAPLLSSRREPGVIYHGSNILLRSENGGQDWRQISPDLTRNDKEKQKWSGGPITGDNTGVEIYDTIFSLAESSTAAGELWAGTDDGLVHVTRDGGANWTNVTPAGSPEWATIESIALSTSAAGTAWIAVDAHRLDDHRPFVFRTRDGGVAWENVVQGLPPSAYVLSVREDPKVPDLLYAGTRFGIFLSRDGGDHWEAFKLNLPPVVVTDLEVKDDDLVVATSGRSLWILDDLSAIRQWSSETAAEPLHLFTPRPARRRQVQTGWSGEAVGENPPRGAVLHYSLASKVAGEAILEIFDAEGRRVRKLSSVALPQVYAEDDPDEPMKAPEAALQTSAGLQRVVWDLRWEGAHRLENAKVDLGDPTNGPMAIPGTYRLRLSAGGQSAETTLTVLPDPRSKVSAADSAEQLRFTLGLRAQLDRVVAAVGDLRAIQAQAGDLANRLAGNARATGVLAAAERTKAKAAALEHRFHNPKAEVVYDILAQRGGTQLHSNLTFVYLSAASGEGAPTQGVRDVATELERVLVGLEREFQELKSGDLADFEREADALRLPRVLLRQSIEGEDLE